MKNILIFSSFLTLVVGVALLYFAFGSVWNWTFAGLFVVGLAAIAAALKYTLGKKPYGYKALGDAFVFVFFGPVAILGTLLLYNPQFASWPLNFGSVWAGIWCGLNAVLILTINNIRDLHKDKQVGKITIPVLLGPNKAEWYFHILSLASVLAFVAFRVHTDSFSLAPILLPIVHLFVFNVWLRKLSTNPSHQAYTQMLKFMSISFLLSPLFAWL
jgi:1,4-dihydroxy-2-naphthoate octaprenyltransferase